MCLPLPNWHTASQQTPLPKGGLHHPTHLAPLLMVSSRVVRKPLEDHLGSVVNELHAVCEYAIPCRREMAKTDRAHSLITRNLLRPHSALLLRLQGTPRSLSERYTWSHRIRLSSSGDTCNIISVVPTTRVFYDIYFSFRFVHSDSTGMLDLGRTGLKRGLRQ